MSEVTRNTGFARGLFDDVESDSGKVKDKASKVAWLTKIIACVGLALGEHVRARPLKIVAGLEPEHTNAFLQQLARAASAGDAADAVRRTLAGETFAGGDTAGAARDPREEPRDAREPHTGSLSDSVVQDSFDRCHVAEVQQNVSNGYYCLSATS